MADVAVTLLAVLGGFASGILSAVLGVGGAVLTTPVIRALGADPLAAVASTVPAIIPGAVSGGLRYQSEGYIDWRVALVCGGTGMGFAVLGGWAAGQVDARWLMIATALLLAWSGTSLLRSARADAGTTPPTDATDPRSDPAAGATVIALPTTQARPPTLAVAALGIAAGFLAGILGIGGGVLLTPGLSVGLGMPVKRAVASSLVAVAMMSCAALATHVVLGHVDWRYALPLMVGVVPGARLGARITVGSSETRMRTTAGALLLGIAGLFLLTELIALP